MYNFNRIFINFFLHKYKHIFKNYAKFSKLHAHFSMRSANHYAQTQEYFFNSFSRLITPMYPNNAYYL